MRKMALIGIAILMFILSSTDVEADESDNDYSTPQIIRCTCYTGYNYTYSGYKPFEGCRYISGSKDWQGCVAILYRVNADGSIGNFLGYYEIVDTGKAKSIQNKKSIDKWMPNLMEAQDWVDCVGDYVYLQVVKGKG